MVNQLEELGREKLRELLVQCTESQVAIFNRAYGSVDVIPPEQIDRAIKQCDLIVRTMKAAEAEPVLDGRINPSMRFP